MIYAIRAVGTEYIKFGRAVEVQDRLRQHQTSNPFALVLLAEADWPDAEESRILAYLSAFRVRGEWVRESSPAFMVIDLLQRGQEGLEHWRELCASVVEKAEGRPSRLAKVFTPQRLTWTEPSQEIPESLKDDDRATAQRFEGIKQRALERRARKAANAA